MESLLGIRDYQPLLHARAKAKPSAKGKTKASAKAEEIRELLATPPESESEHGAEAGGMGEAGFDALAQDLEEVISEAELSEAVDFYSVMNAKPGGRCLRKRMSNFPEMLPLCASSLALIAASSTLINSFASHVHWLCKKRRARDVRHAHALQTMKNGGGIEASTKRVVKLLKFVEIQTEVSF